MSLPKKVSDSDLKALIGDLFGRFPSYDTASRELRKRGFRFTEGRFRTIWKQFIEPAVPVDSRSLRERLMVILQHDPISYSELARRSSIPLESVILTLEQMQREGMNLQITNQGVSLHDTIAIQPPDVIDITKFKNKHRKFGLTADNHLCSRYSRLDVLNALFDIWKDEGIEKVYQCGNIIDGEARFNRHDLLATGIQGQVDYLIQNWPQREGLVTEFITGDDHEGWYIQREGINIGEHIQFAAEKAGRTDLKFIGHMEKSFDLRANGGHSLMSLIHAGGGSAYAVSYSTQKIVESFQGGEKPNILLVGHYHKFDYGYPREVHALQVGCTQDQTPFMRKKKIQAMVGGVTIEFDQDDMGIVHAFKVTWHPFYDRNFYKGESWKYHWKGKQ